MNALELTEKLFRDLENRNKEAVFDMFTDDAVFFDPHYPNIEMKGRKEIEFGLEWGFASMKQFGFTIVHQFVSKDGTKAAVEIDTHHTLAGGQKLNFPQAFFAEAKAGKLIAFRAYEPYRPNGIGGFFLRLSHLKAKMFGV